MNKKSISHHQETIFHFLKHLLNAIHTTFIVLPPIIFWLKKFNTKHHSLLKLPNGMAIQTTETAIQLNRTAIQMTGTAIQLTGMEMQTNEMETQLNRTALQTTEMETQLNQTALQTTETETQLNQTAIQTTETETQLNRTAMQTTITPTQLDSISNHKKATRQQTNSSSLHTPKIHHQFATVQAHLVLPRAQATPSQNQKSLHFPHCPPSPTNSYTLINLTIQPFNQSRIRQHRFCASAVAVVNLKYCAASFTFVLSDSFALTNRA